MCYVCKIIVARNNTIQSFPESKCFISSWQVHIVDIYFRTNQAILGTCHCAFSYNKDQLFRSMSAIKYTHFSILLQFRVPLSYGQKRPAAACRNDERAVEIFKLFFSLFPFYALAEKLFKRTLTLSSNQLGLSFPLNDTYRILGLRVEKQ